MNNILEIIEEFVTIARAMQGSECQRINTLYYGEMYELLSGNVGKGLDYANTPYYFNRKREETGREGFNYPVCVVYPTSGSFDKVPTVLGKNLAFDIDFQLWFVDVKPKSGAKANDCNSRTHEQIASDCLDIAMQFIAEVKRRFRDETSLPTLAVNSVNFSQFMNEHKENGENSGASLAFTARVEICPPAATFDYNPTTTTDFQPI